MEGFDRGFASLLRELEAGLQQAMYYAIFIDLFLLIAIGVFIWCCCIFVISYKKLAEESVRLKKAQKQYVAVKSEHKRLEIKRLKLEYGFSEELENLIKVKRE